MTTQSIKSTTSISHIVEPQNRPLAAIQGWGLFLLTLHLAAFQLPEEMAWSLWPYTLLPTWLGWSLALLAGTLIIPAVSQAILSSLAWLWSVWPGKHALGRPAWFGIATLLAGLLFWLARLRHLGWGDSYLLSVVLSHPDLETRVIYNWQAPLTVFLHQRLWQFVADPWLGWPVETVYALVSIICGMISIYVLLIFLSQLGCNPVETAVLAGLMLSIGSMQLFFGYVENYTVISLGIIVTLFLAWRALPGKIQPVWPALALSLTNGFHPSTVFLWPGMGLLVWLCWRRGYVSLARSIGQLALPPLFVAGAIFVLMQSGGHGLEALMGVDRPGGGDGIWFVPLFETTTRWQHYTMFSAAHLLDWSNEHLLISPFGLPLIVMALLTIRRFQLTVFERTVDRDYAYFLGASAGSYLLLTWLWNPDYGGRKDWDLFAPSAFVYTLLAGYLLVRVLPDREKLSQAGLFITVGSLLHTGAWIFANTQLLSQ